jgi:hypothetical protein
MARDREYRPILAGTLWLAAFLVCALVIVVAWQALSIGGRRPAFLRQDLRDNPPSVALNGDEESRIKMFCGDCHAMPRAEDFPRDRWEQEVRQGYEYYARSGRNDLEPPPIHLTVRYFRSRAPERLVFPEAAEAETGLRATFAVEKLDWYQNRPVQPAVSELRWTHLDAEEHPVLLTCDMRDGSVAAFDLRDRQRRRQLFARLNHPCHAEPCDLDEDGAVDLVVADLGSFSAVDHDRGRVVWLRRRQGGDSFEEVVLASGLGRVADVRSADFDADGDLDLIVAEFGHYRTGGILLLRNVAARGEPPRFEPEEIDPRPGTIHLPPHDFNGDGCPDFAALVSQEHECVDVFLNRGNGRFDRYTAWAAPDLTFASSGIELVDMDRDGDMDVLYSNGDSFDNLYANPSHGVQWLENLGRLEFAYHRLADLPGAYRALAGDIDLDGDLDVIVAAWLPQQVKPPSLKAAPLISILCLEQTSPGQFVRHTLETGSAHYAVMELADFDDDGDLDFAVGSHAGLDGADSPSGMSPLAVWWNQAIRAGQ